MEYTELKEMIEKVKTMQMSDTEFLAYRWIKLEYEDYTEIDVVNATDLIGDMFTQLNAFEDDVERAELLFKEYEFQSRDEFIKDNIESVIGDYLYHYGSTLEPYEFHEEMIGDKQYKNYTPEEMKNMWEQLKEYEQVRFTDDGYECPYDFEEDHEEVLDWWIELCEDNLKRDLYDDYGYLEYLEEELAWKREYLRNDEYICSECFKVIKCAATEHMEGYKILCEKCMSEAAVIESIKTELFF